MVKSTNNRNITLIEGEIVSLLASGDCKSIKLIDKFYYDSLFIIANNILNDINSSKDVLQEVLIQVWLNAKSYNPKKGSLYTWLFRITKNKAIDRIRFDNIRRDKENRDELVNQYNFKDKSINIDSIDLVDNLNKITNRYRTVVYLSFFKGLTHVEISEQCCIPLGTVKSRLKIGLRELKKIYINER